MPHDMKQLLSGLFRKQPPVSSPPRCEGDELKG